jgi:RND family efflux transporter MFP subunit
MMNRNAVFGLMLMVAAVPVLTACNAGQAQDESAAVGTAASTARVVNVETIEVQPEPFADRVDATGQVMADRDVVVASEENGVVRAILVDKGARVSEGQALVRIDDRLLKAQHDQAVSEAALARETYERQRRLWEEDSIGSELTFLRAKYGAETADANARGLATRLERTTIRAPIGGILDARMVEVGSTLSPGSPVGRIVDADPLKVIAGVPERYAGEVRTGANAIVSFDNGRIVEARASFVGTAIDDQSRTFPIEVVVRNEDGMLKPGMVANVRVSRGSQREAILVPRDAVMRVQSGYILYVATERNGQWVAEARAVATGSGDAGRVVITDGLEAGEQVIVAGQQQVAGGDLIRVQRREGGQ